MACLCALLAPAAARATLIGPQDFSTSNGSNGCSNAFCSYANVKLPAGVGVVRSPISGKITKWRVMVANYGTGTGPLRLQVLRRTQDSPGFSNDKLRVIRQTSSSPSKFGLNAFRSSLKISKGDFIGLVLTNQTSVEEVDAPGGVIGNWDPAPSPGDPAAAWDYVTPATYLLFNATVKP